MVGTHKQSKVTLGASFDGSLHMGEPDHSPLFFISFFFFFLFAFLIPVRFFFFLFAFLISIHFFFRLSHLTLTKCLGMDPTKSWNIWVMWSENSVPNEWSLENLSILNDKWWVTKINQTAPCSPKLQTCFSL